MKREHNSRYIMLTERRHDVDLALQRYMLEAAESEPLSAEKEAELAVRIKRGDIEARNKMVEANLRFVISVALEYQHQGLDLGELISAGNVGLITAAERFDETKGFKFISYAVWWVRQAVLQALAEHNRTVRLPVNRVDLMRRIARCTADLTQSKSEPPSPQEIADELEISVKQVLDTLASGQRILSLDATFDGDNPTSMLDIMPDDPDGRPDANLRRTGLEDDVEVALDTLEKREADVVRLYFGLGGIPPLTLEEIGVKFGLTRERIRQIKEKALRKLRHPTRGKWLKGHAEEDGLIEPSPSVYSVPVPAKQKHRQVYNRSMGALKLATNPPRY